MILSASLTCLIALIFALPGAAKILAPGPMPELAAHAGFTTAAYRVIGTLELAGAIGVALGPVVPLCGGLAGIGLLMLLAGAVTTHVRKGDGLTKLLPAVTCGPGRLVSRTPLRPLTRSWRPSAATRPVSEPTAGLAD